MGPPKVSEIVHISSKKAQSSDCALFDCWHNNTPSLARSYTRDTLGRLLAGYVLAARLCRCARSGWSFPVDDSFGISTGSPESLTRGFLSKAVVDWFPPALQIVMSGTSGTSPTDRVSTDGGKSTTLKPVEVAPSGAKSTRPMNFDDDSPERGRSRNISVEPLDDSVSFSPNRFEHRSRPAHHVA